MKNTFTFAVDVLYQKTIVYIINFTKLIITDENWSSFAELVPTLDHL